MPVDKLSERGLGNVFFEQKIVPHEKHGSGHEFIVGNTAPETEGGRHKLVLLFGDIERFYTDIRPVPLKPGHDLLRTAAMFASLLEEIGDMYRFRESLDLCWGQYRLPRHDHAFRRLE